MKPSNLALIAPVPDLHLVEGPGFHLLEAPIVLSDQEYVDFYRLQPQAYLICDNGAALGHTVTDKELVKAVYAIGADEVVVPDEMADPVETFNRAQAFFAEYKESAPYYMVVPQGTNLEEWLTNYTLLEDLVGSLGLEKRVTYGVGKHMHARVGGRAILVSYILHDDHPVHLLGASSQPKDDLKILNIIRSYDTSLPFALGQQGIELTADVPATRGGLDFFKTSGELGIKNMQTMINWTLSDAKSLTR